MTAPTSGVGPGKPHGARLYGAGRSRLGPRRATAGQVVEIVTCASRDPDRCNRVDPRSIGSWTLGGSIDDQHAWNRRRWGTQTRVPTVAVAVTSRWACWWRHPPAAAAKSTCTTGTTARRRDGAQHADPDRHQGRQPGGHGAVQAHLGRQGHRGHRRLLRAERVLRHRQHAPSSAWTSTSATPSARCSASRSTSQNASFDTIIPAMGTRYDVVMSSFTDTARAPAEGRHGHLLHRRHLVLRRPRARTSDLTSLDALCGKNVGVEKGTTAARRRHGPVDQVHERRQVQGQRACSFPDQNGANVALASGRVDVVMADSPVAAYAAKQSSGQVRGRSASPTAPPPTASWCRRPSDYAGLATPSSVPSRR